MSDPVSDVDLMSPRPPHVGAAARAAPLPLPVLLALALLLLLPRLPGTATAETLCDNQLSASPSRWGADDGSWFSAFATSGLPGLHASPTAPAPGQFSKTCRYYDRAPKVCCSASTLTAIEDTFTAAQPSFPTYSHCGSYVAQ